jgi:hypothetical protein
VTDRTVIGFYGRDGEGRPVLWQPFTPCPCGCERTASKLTKYGHVTECACPSCRGRRSRTKGRRAQARGYRRLGGLAPFTPGNEENSGTFSVEVQAEMKAGRQIPREFVRFARSEWARRAWSQAERAIPAGVQAEPAIYCELPKEDGGGAFLIVTLGPSHVKAKAV